MCGVNPYALGVTDERIDDALDVADSGHVVVKRHVLRCAYYINFGPAQAAHRVRATLLVAPPAIRLPNGELRITRTDFLRWIDDLPSAA